MNSRIPLFNKETPSSMAIGTVSRPPLISLCERKQTAAMFVYLTDDTPNNRIDLNKVQQ